MASFTVAFDVFVGSATDVAVIVTVPPAGVVAGAEYTVTPPLAVGDKLNDPHEPMGMQLQVTPMFAASFVTVAARFAFVDVCIADGGGVVMVTATGAVMVMV